MKLKKILASILCVAMVLSTMSFAVFAEATVYEVTTDAELSNALSKAVDGDTIKLAAGEYKGGISVGRDITLEGSIDKDGNPATVFSGGGTAIYISQGTVKNIGIKNASKGFYGEPCKNVNFDNVHMFNLLYGFHLVAYSSDVTWTITNCYTDIQWANSFGKHKCDGAEIILKNNEFVSTEPYYVKNTEPTL